MVLPLYFTDSTVPVSAADALVSAIAPTEKTVIAESMPARILVLIVFVFFMLFTPFEFVVLVVVLVVVKIFVFFMAVSPFVYVVIRVYQVDVDSLFTNPKAFEKLFPGLFFSLSLNVALLYQGDLCNFFANTKGF